MWQICAITKKRKIIGKMSNNFLRFHSKFVENLKRNILKLPTMKLLR